MQKSSTRNYSVCIFVCSLLYRSLFIVLMCDVGAALVLSVEYSSLHRLIIMLISFDRLFMLYACYVVMNHLFCVKKRFCSQYSRLTTRSGKNNKNYQLSLFLLCIESSSSTLHLTYCRVGFSRKKKKYLHLNEMFTFRRCPFVLVVIIMNFYRNMPHKCSGNINRQMMIKVSA